MKLTIVPNDNTVIVDGVAATVDLSHLPDCIHAIQWDGDAERGEVEYVTPANRRFASLDEIAEPEPAEGKVALSREAIEIIIQRHGEVVASWAVSAGPLEGPVNVSVPE